jgi:hypothetical protein
MTVKTVKTIKTIKTVKTIKTIKTVVKTIKTVKTVKTIKTVKTNVLSTTHNDIAYTYISSSKHKCFMFTINDKGMYIINY